MSRKEKRGKRVRVFSGLLFFIFLAWPSGVFSQDSGQAPGVTQAPQGPIAYGQGGVLYTGPEGTFVVVPDQTGVVRSYSLSDAVESAVRAQSSPGPAVGFGFQDQAAQNMEQQAGAQPNQLICECHCPPCPGTAESVQESPAAPGQAPQEDQPAEQEQSAQIED
ncbi:MAG: hypothetical protein A2428_05675 [Bdellovibrionales bacterium RIFOXYC1_FULL_54_43]|nr:MAG: hypothetical protein A2428_05675 [Bdellovibrionales bacterium RIFOXYC1_FULL_54_43]